MDISIGTCTFKITGMNEKMIESFSKYAMMLDYVSHSDASEQLNIDGILNSLLDDALKRRIKDICKRHGFLDLEDFMEVMDGCQDGEEVIASIREREHESLKQAHDNILAHMPIDDKQCRLPFDGGC